MMYLHPVYEVETKVNISENELKEIIKLVNLFFRLQT